MLWEFLDDADQDAQSVALVQGVVDVASSLDKHNEVFFLHKLAESVFVICEL